MVSRMSPVSSAALVSEPPPTSTGTAEGQLERTVAGLLHSHPGLNVCSLVVHRCRDGLCLEGHVILVDPDLNLAELLAAIDTTTPILNRVLVSSPAAESSSDLVP